jgi:hypothetical protein
MKLLVRTYENQPKRFYVIFNSVFREYVKCNFPEVIIFDRGYCFEISEESDFEMMRLHFTLDDNIEYGHYLGAS